MVFVGELGGRVAGPSASCAFSGRTPVARCTVREESPDKVRGVAAPTANTPLADSTDFASTAMESAMPNGRPRTPDPSGFAAPSPAPDSSLLETCCLDSGVVVLDPVTLEVLDWPSASSTSVHCPRHPR